MSPEATIAQRLPKRNEVPVQPLNPTLTHPHSLIQPSESYSLIDPTNWRETFRWFSAAVNAVQGTLTSSVMLTSKTSAT
jgi:hypothetical protein